jgi:hypothetical protein
MKKITATNTIDKLTQDFDMQLMAILKADLKNYKNKANKQTHNIKQAA